MQFHYNIFVTNYANKNNQLIMQKDNLFHKLPDLLMLNIWSPGSFGGPVPGGSDDGLDYNLVITN